jgi:hypothetical protein
VLFPRIKRIKTYSPVSSAGIKMFWKVMETGMRVMGTAREGQLKRIWA